MNFRFEVWSAFINTEWKFSHCSLVKRQNFANCDCSHYLVVKNIFLIRKERIIHIIRQCLICITDYCSSIVRLYSTDHLFLFRELGRQDPRQHCVSAPTTCRRPTVCFRSFYVSACDYGGDLPTDIAGTVQTLRFGSGADLACEMCHRRTSTSHCRCL